MNERKLERLLDNYLEEFSFEEFLENFDLTPYEVTQALYDDGLLDDEILERMLPTDA